MKIEAKMEELRRALAGSAAPRTSSGTLQPKTGGRRELSPEARERIAAAQRRRWAAYKKAKGKAKAKAAA